MKNIKLILAIISILTMMFLYMTSCTKDRVYIEHPTCRRFIEVRDVADADMTYLRTDTLHPESSISQIACDNTLIEMQNYIPYWEGCANNRYERYRYLIH